MTAREHPDEFKQRSAIEGAAETRAILHRAAEDVRRSGALARTLKVGDPTPEFT